MEKPLKKSERRMQFVNKEERQGEKMTGEEEVKKTMVTWRKAGRPIWKW